MSTRRTSNEVNASVSNTPVNVHRRGSSPYIRRPSGTVVRDNEDTSSRYRTPVGNQQRRNSTKSSGNTIILCSMFDTCVADTVPIVGVEADNGRLPSLRPKCNIPPQTISKPIRHRLSELESSTSSTTNERTITVEMKAQPVLRKSSSKNLISIGKRGESPKHRKDSQLSSNDKILSPLAPVLRRSFQKNDKQSISDMDDTMTALPPKYSVFNMPSAGMLFEVIKRTLIERGDWVEVKPDGLVEVKNNSAAAYGGAGATSPNGNAWLGVKMCCSKLFGTNLFMGEKLLTEKLVGEARIVTSRLLRRKGSFPSSRKGASLEACSHVHPNISPHPWAAPPTVSLVSYFEGTRCITLKSRMIKTMQEYFRRGGAGATFPAELFDGYKGSANSANQVKGIAGQLYTWDIIPETYTLIPFPSGIKDERDAMINAMKTANDNDPNSEVSTWIAKSSHGCHGDGIKIVSATTGGLRELLEYIDDHNDNFAWVVCRYIDRPLLYQGRKFDIRCWVLITFPYTIYCHKELVMRTSSVPYNRNAVTTNTKEGVLANITNHCVQTTSDTYSHHEEGNELWRDTFAKLIRQTKRPAQHSSLSPCREEKMNKSSPPQKCDIIPPSYSGYHKGSSSLKSVKSNGDISPYAARNNVPSGELGANSTPEDRVMIQIHRIIVHCLLAAQKQAAIEGVSPSPVASRPMSASSPHIDGSRLCYDNIDKNGNSCPPASDTESTSSVSPQSVEIFQMFGFDFILDQWCKVWLLEVNGSPGVADRLMQKIVDDTIELAVEPKFPKLPSATGMDLEKRRTPNEFLQLYPSPNFPYGAV